MDQKVDLTKGGVAVVFVGNTELVAEYKNHPAITFIDAKQKVTDLQVQVPSNCKAIIITEGIDHMNYMWATSFCRQRNIPWLLRKSNQAVYETIKSFFPDGNGQVEKPTSEEVKDAFIRGKLVPLLPMIDFSRSNAENAKYLMRKCHEMGIKSTEGSLAQFVANQRRKLSGAAVPKSARPKLDVSVELLDDMIKQLGDMRDFLIATCEENRLLRDKVEKFKKLLD